MKKAKVVRIITRLNVGGPAINAILLSQDFSQKFDIVLVTGIVGNNEADRGYFAAEKGVNPLIIHQLQRNINIFKDFIVFIKLFFLLKREKPTIVHTHLAKAGTIGRLAAILAGVPIRIHTFHGHAFSGYFPMWQTKIFLLIERFLAKYTNNIITISKTVGYEISDKYKIAPMDKISIIPLGFELEKFSESNGDFFLRKMLGIDENTLLIGIIGRLTRIKNHKLFLDAARIVLEKIKNVRFVVVGDGELRQALENYAKEINIKDYVSFLGWQKDMAPIYQDLDIVVSASLNEGTPVNLIEAMAAGKVVIATNVGGVPDLLDFGRAGILVPSDDKQIFAKEMTELLNNKEKRISLGKRAKESVFKKYTASRLYQDIENLYNNLIEKKRG